MLKIVQAPSDVLSKIAEEIPGTPPKIDPKFLKDMEDALLNAKEPKGVGLAAPQVGKSLAVFIAKPTEKSKIQVFINPVIEELIDEPKDQPKRKGSRGKNKNKQLEGCLSLQDIWGEVKRYPMVKLSYYDENGKYFNKILKGFMAIIVQHEVDHLNGILFPRRVLEQKNQLFHSTKDEEGEVIFEPIKI